MSIFELLTQAGLSKKEAAVYVALYENGELSLTALNKETHINRPALYTLLPKMQREGIISQIKRRKRVFYQAESPEKVLRNYQKEKSDVEEGLSKLAEEYNHTHHERPQIKYLEGDKGMTFVFDDIAHSLPRGSTFFRYSARAGTKKLHRGTYYDKARETKQLERLAIISEAKATRKKPKLERSVRIIPKDYDLFEDNIALLIYGDKTAYIDYGSKTAFIVESPKIARFQEKLFKLLWKKL